MRRKKGSRILGTQLFGAKKMLFLCPKRGAEQEQQMIDFSFGIAVRGRRGHVVVALALRDYHSGGTGCFKTWSNARAHRRDAYHSAASLVAVGMSSRCCSLVCFQQSDPLVQRGLQPCGTDS